MERKWHRGFEALASRIGSFTAHDENKQRVLRNEPYRLRIGGHSGPAAVLEDKLSPPRSKWT